MGVCGRQSAIERRTHLQAPPVGRKVQEKRAILIAHPEASVGHQGQPFRIQPASCSGMKRTALQVKSRFPRLSVTGFVRQPAKGLSLPVAQRYLAQQPQRAVLVTEHANVRHKVRQGEHLAVGLRSVHIRTAVGQQPESGILGREGQIGTITAQADRRLHPDRRRIKRYGCRPWPTVRCPPVVRSTREG